VPAKLGLNASTCCVYSSSLDAATMTTRRMSNNARAAMAESTVVAHILHPSSADCVSRKRG